VLTRGDKLSAISKLVNWNGFLSIADGLYKNNTERGGRPNIDVIIMIKLLILQQMYGLSDPQLELQVADRISFRVFLGTTETIPITLQSGSFARDSKNQVNTKLYGMSSQTRFELRGTM
jgi:transposase